MERITGDMLQELTEEQKEKLRELWIPKEGQEVYYEYEEGEGFYTGFDKYGVLPLLSIGQMIDILDSNTRAPKLYRMGKWFVEFSKNYESVEFQDFDLYKALWQAVKSIL